MPPRHVYVHVPFCARRCVYCDFSIAVRRETPVAEFQSALARELALRFADSEPWTIETLYLGGGTPSRLGGAGVADVIELFRSRSAFAFDAEITIEANPDDVTSANVDAWVHAGVNRVSLGVQSFDDDVLAWMHRTHDSDAVPRAVDMLRRAGIDNLSLDLIFALPPSVRRSWDNDVARAIALAPSHVSLYGLTVESHTPLGRLEERGTIAQAPEESYEHEFLSAHEAFSHVGLEHYEVSNFGRPGKPSRHNSAYWRGVPYAGLGPSSHEFDGTARRWNVSAYAEWLRCLEAGTDPIAGREELSTDNRAAERVYLGLRTLDGLLLTEAEEGHARPWIEAGWATLHSNRRLVLTPLGWLRLDAIAADLTLFGSRY